MECIILKLVDGHHIAVSGEPEGHLCYCVRLLFYKDMKISFTCACHFFMDNSFLQGHEYILYLCVSFFYMDNSHLIPASSRWRHGRDQEYIKELQLEDESFTKMIKLTIDH